MNYKQRVIQVEFRDKPHHILVNYTVGRYDEEWDPVVKLNGPQYEVNVISVEAPYLRKRHAERLTEEYIERNLNLFI